MKSTLIIAIFVIFYIKVKKYMNNFDACNFLYQNKKVPE